MWKTHQRGIIFIGFCVICITWLSIKWASGLNTLVPASGIGRTSSSIDSTEMIELRSSPLAESADSNDSSALNTPQTKSLFGVDSEQNTDIQNEAGLPITVDRALIANLAVGDKVAINIPQFAIDHEVTISHIEKQGKDLSIRGKLEDGGAFYSVFITHGEHATFALLSNSTGTFSIESIEERGRLFDNQLSDRSFNYFESDQVSPDEVFTPAQLEYLNATSNQ